MKTLLALAALAVAAVPCHARPVLVVSQKAAKASLNPSDPVWTQAPVARIPVMPQALVIPRGGGAVAYVEVQSLRSGGDIFVRLRWPDPSKSETLELSSKFVDGAAVEFPIGAGPLPAPMMGQKGRPVNIWRWSAAMTSPDHYPKSYADYHRPDALEKTIQYPRKAEDLVAEGWGTVGRRSEQKVEARGEWEDGFWSVVFKRGLRSAQGVSFASDAPLPIAVAVWEGGAKERGSAKSLSVWHYLLLDGKQPSLPKDSVGRGLLTYQRYGCGACHGDGGKGGIPNPGAQVDPVPDLELAAEGFTKAELKQVIMEGRMAAAKDERSQPPLAMNAWKVLMSDEEADALVDYIFSLMPKDRESEW